MILMPVVCLLIIQINLIIESQHFQQIILMQQ